MPVITDKEKINEVLTRGVANVYPTPEFLAKRLQSGERLTLYTGYDPTAPSLHIGHGITLLKLRQFQELGHRVIMLIGDFTARIGDPTDKSAARQQLSAREVKKNYRLYKKQASRILNFSIFSTIAAKLKYNSRWLAKLKLEDLLNLGGHFTVQRMLERDMFEKRMKEGKPIYLHEFMYPMMQGYDSVMMDVDGEVGGNDQTFNMLTGRDLMKDLKNKEKFVVTLKLLADNSTGKKMSKSEGNAIFLSDSPEDMFGKVMSWTDEMIISGFELCTKVPMNEIKEMGEKMSAGANPRDYKLRLAEEVTKQFLGAGAAARGREHFIRVIQSNSRPDAIPEIHPSQADVATVLAESGICKSKSEARQIIDQGGVKINEEKVAVGNYTALVKPGDVVKKGSRFFVKII